MTTEEKELHEFFKSILSEKAWAKFQRMMELQSEKYGIQGLYVQQTGRISRAKIV
jgi:hypothetical protein